MSISTSKPPAEPKLPDGFEPRMLSFDVYGTLVNTPPANLGAFRAILADAGRLDLDPEEFYSFWEQRNIVSNTADFDQVGDKWAKAAVTGLEKLRANQLLAPPPPPKAAAATTAARPAAAKQ